MGKPEIVGSYGNVVHEIISAMSSLNMYPTEIPDEENVFLQDGKPKEELYISEKFEMAQHSYQHMQAAMRSLIEYRDGMRDKMIKIIQEMIDEGEIKSALKPSWIARIIVDEMNKE